MAFIEKHKFFITFIFGAIILMVTFYWFEYRPDRIRRNCYRIALLGTTEKDYQNCLRDNGLEK